MLGAVPAAADTVRDFAVLGTATLTVARAEGARACAGARALSEQLVPLIKPAPKDAVELAIDVAIERTPDEWVADIVVRGTSEQVRKLRAPGSDCSELERRLTALLSTVLDRSVTGALPPDKPAAPTALVPAAQATPERERGTTPALRSHEAADNAETTGERRGRGTSSGWSALYSAGLGETLGVAGEPMTWFLGSLALERGALALWLTGFTSLDATNDLAPGSVEVSLAGGLVRPCVVALEAGPASLRGCGALMMASLRGESRGYRVNDTEHTPYFALGAGALGVIKLGALPFVGLEATALAPLRRKSFSIDGRGVAFETPRAGAWFGASLGLPIW